MDNQETEMKPETKAKGFWHSPILNKIAIKFGNFADILIGIVYLILSLTLFDEGGFWGIVFGILFVISAASYVIEGVKGLIGRDKQELTEEELDKKKKHLCIGVVVIAVILVIVLNMEDSVYTDVKAISFDDYGSETIGELIENNIKSPQWSKSKIDNTSEKVSVEGYSPALDENIRINFFYEVSSDTYEVTLQRIELPDSGEKYSSNLEIAIIWTSFYD